MSVFNLQCVCLSVDVCLCLCQSVCLSVNVWVWHCRVKMSRTVIHFTPTMTSHTNCSVLRSTRFRWKRRSVSAQTGFVFFLLHLYSYVYFDFSCTGLAKKQTILRNFIACACEYIEGHSIYQNAVLFLWWYEPVRRTGKCDDWITIFLLA